MTKTRLAFLAGICLFTWPKAEAALLTFDANLTVAQTVPSSGCTFNGAPCFGTATLTLDTTTDAFSMSMMYTTGSVLNLHLDDGAPGTNGPTEVFLLSSLSVPCGSAGTFCRNILITDGFSIPSGNVSDLIAGNDYIVATAISSSPDGSGQIRGQLQPVPEPSSLTLMVFGTLAFAAALLVNRGIL